MKLKKFLAVFLSVLMLGGILPSNANGWLNFPDFSFSAKAETDELIYGENDEITRAQWIYDLTLLFDMSVEEACAPDNYFSDLDENHEYYYEIISAVQFGVIDIEAGENLYPDEIVTRDFAASTLNFCLGYQLEDATYSFSDSESVTDADSAQIAINRGWFMMSGGKFMPEKTITEAEIRAMFADVKTVLDGAQIDESYDNQFTFENDVKVVPETVLATQGENGVVTITDCPISISNGDKFAVYFNGMPVVYTANSVNVNGSITEIATESAGSDTGFVDFDAEGILSSDAMEIIPAEGVEVEVEEENISTFSSRSVKKIKNINVDKTFSLGDGADIDVSVSIKNPYIEYNIKKDYVSFVLNGDTTVEYGVSLDWLSGYGIKKSHLLFTVNICGLGSFDVNLVYDLSGSASGTVVGVLRAGLECRKGSGIRVIRNFLQTDYYSKVEATAKVGLKATLGVTQVPSVSAYIYAEIGAKTTFRMDNYTQGTPKQCVDYSAYLYASYGAKASIEIGSWSESYSKDFDIYTKYNSPVRIVNHYEDDKLVSVCKRGTGGRSYYTKGYNSRYGGSGWAGYNGLYGLDGSGNPVQLFEYELGEDNSAIITAYNGNSSYVNIPDKIEGHNVTAIGDYAFCEKKITYVDIPETVTLIGQSAFERCEHLRTVNLSKNITAIEGYAFYNCINLTNITIPESVTKIGVNAFDSCLALKEIKLPKKLEELGSYAFAYTCIKSIEIPMSLESAEAPFAFCNNLKTVTFEHGVTAIIDDLFKECTGIETIQIPKNATYIGYMAFEKCENLQSVTISNSIKSIESYAFMDCKSLTEIEIPDSVTKIENDAFVNCENLKTVKLSKNINYIGSAAFGNTAIQSINIPKSLDYCGYFAGPFYNCSNLKTVTFENGITSIPAWLLSQCNGIEEITIPDTVEVIEESAFGECSNLKKVVVPDSVTRIERYAFNLDENLKDIKLPDSVTEIEENAFNSCGFEEFTIPAFIKTIEASVFSECKNLKKITIPSDVEKIDSYAFNSCQSLTKVEFAENSKLTEIALASFEKCTSLEEIILPENINTLGMGAFSGCTSLKKVYIPQSVKELEYRAFLGCSSLSDLTIKDYSIKTISSECFKGCMALEKVVLPKGLTTIYEDAFVNCVELKEITIPQSVTDISNTAFSYPDEMTIKGVAGSYAEDFANENGIEFTDITAPCEGLALKDFATNVTVGAGETYRAEFDMFPEENTDIITLTTDSNDVIIDGLDIKTYYSTNALITATTSSGSSYEFNLIVRSINEIEVVAKPNKTTYALGEKLDLTGIKVLAVYDDNSTEEITDYTVSGFDSSAEGICTVNIEWKSANGWSYSTSFTVDVIDTSPKLVGIFIESLPNKRSYELREKLDTTGLIVKGTYNDNSTRAITDYTISGYNALKKGIQTITVTVGDFTATFTVAVGQTLHEHNYDNDCDADCNSCGATRTITHNYAAATCTKAKTCKVCGITSGKALGHIYTNTCDKNCNRCMATRSIKHTYTNACDTSCNVCKATRSITHSYKTTTTKATLTKNGSIVKKCTVCGKVASNTPIKYAKTFKLSTTVYTYTGKAITPSVTVKDSAGKSLKKNTDYTVSFASGRKNVGTYKVTVKMIGKYSGTQTLTFKINPPKTTVSKLTAGKKSITVAITKKSTQVTGYQVQYSTSKTFSKATTKTISSYKTTKYSLKKLSAKKVYYVRVRTYKTVGKTKYYSGWSTYRYVKTK